MDASLPECRLSDALSDFRDRGLHIPFIVVSRSPGEEAAVRAIKEGAHDYILKSQLFRLGPVVKRELAVSAE